MSNDWFSSSATASSYNYWNDRVNIKARGGDEVDPQSGLKIDFEAIKNEMETELHNIAKEQEEDKEKHLPKFDPEDLDI